LSEVTEREVKAMLEDAFGKNLWNRIGADMIQQAEEAQRTTKAKRAREKAQRERERERL
jgi:hypothetical protein